MRINTLLYGIFVLLIVSVAFLWQGCYKFAGNQQVPAYLQISDISIQTSYYDQGTNSSSITDAWVYIDDALLGVFELPAHFPVLAEGKHKVEIRPGIKLNGISSTRVPYPFYKPIIFESRNFIPEITDSLKSLSTTYYSNTSFQWMEDFEGSDISFDESTSSDTVIKQTLPKNSPDAFLSAFSHFSGRISLTEDKPEYVGYSYNSFALPPSQGSAVLLELNFKTNNVVTVGLLMRFNESYTEIPLVILGQTDEWKKIYINLGPNISLNSTADDYKVVFKAGLESSNTNAEILLDNIKLVSRQ